MAIWFATLAVAGLVHLVHYPRVLLALSPNYALAFAGHVGAGSRSRSWVRCFSP
jgi:K+ transporter